MRWGFYFASCSVLVAGCYQANDLSVRTAPVVLDGSIDGGIPNADAGDAEPPWDGGVAHDAGAPGDASTDGATSSDADVIDGASDAWVLDDGSTVDAGTWIDGGAIDASFDAALPDGTVPFDAGFDASTDASSDAGSGDPLACVTKVGLPAGTDTSVPSRPGYGIDAPTAELVALATSLVGTWSGTQDSPWEPNHQVTIAFYADGTYSASCEGGSCLPFYYGEACPVHRGFWRLDLGAQTDAYGELRIFYAGSGTSTTEDIRHMRIDGTRLTFEQWHFSTYGPIVFDLDRLATP